MSVSGENSAAARRSHLRLIKGGLEDFHSRPRVRRPAVSRTHLAIEIRVWHRREVDEPLEPVEPIAIPGVLAYSEGGVPVVSVEDTDGPVHCEPRELKEAGYDYIVVLEEPAGDQEELLGEAAFWGYRIEPRVCGGPWRDVW